MAKKVNKTTIEFDEFTMAYIICSLWASTDDEGDPMDSSYGPKDIHPTTLKTMKADCKKFQKENEKLLNQALNTLDAPHYDLEDAGTDLWLTRNGHSSGYFDQNLGEIGDKLTEAARAYGVYNLYVGNDGMVYGEKG